MAVLDSPQGQESAASGRQDRLSTEQIPSAMHGKEERTQGSTRSWWGHIGTAEQGESVLARVGAGMG